MTVDGKPPRRSAGAGPILAIIALLATIGTVAAAIAYRRNVARAARYAVDPSCQAPLVVGSPSAPNALCTTEPATITAQWVHRNRGSRYYRLAMHSDGRAIDSVEVKGANAKAIWNALPVGSAVTVQRFTDVKPDQRRVTLVTTGGLSALTAWNPAWQEKNTKTGMWFLGIIALLSAAALVRLRARRGMS